MNFTLTLIGVDAASHNLKTMMDTITVFLLIVKFLANFFGACHYEVSQIL